MLPPERVDVRVLGWQRSEKALLIEIVVPFCVALILFQL